MLKDILNHSELTKLIADEDFAREFIEFLRWPNGATCPRCEATKVYKIAANVEKKVRKGLYKCAACKKQFTVTVGTIFEDSHVALNKWIHAIHLLCSSKKGFSAHQLHRTLGIRYPSAWHLMHRIRHVMAAEMPEVQFDGIVEADETYIGGKAKNMHAKVRKEKIQGRGAVGKEAVFTLVERGGSLPTGADVRLLPSILKHPEARKAFLEKGASLAEVTKIVNAVEPEQGSEFFKLLAKMREACSSVAQVKEILRIRTDPVARQRMLDTYEAMVNFMLLADVEPPPRDTD